MLLDLDQGKSYGHRFLRAWWTAEDLIQAEMLVYREQKPWLWRKTNDGLHSASVVGELWVILITQSYHIPA